MPGKNYPRLCTLKIMEWIYFWWSEYSRMAYFGFSLSLTVWPLVAYSLGNFCGSKASCDLQELLYGCEIVINAVICNTGPRASIIALLTSLYDKKYKEDFGTSLIYHERPSKHICEKAGFCKAWGKAQNLLKPVSLQWLPWSLQHSCSAFDVSRDS